MLGYLPAVPAFLTNSLAAIVGYVPATYNLMDSGQDFTPDVFGVFTTSHTWSTTSATITTGVTSPANTTTAQKLVEGVANSTHRVYLGSNDNVPGLNTTYLSLNQIDGVIWRLACIAKPAGRNRITLNIVSGFGSTATLSVGFDLAGVQTNYSNSTGTGWTIVGTPSIQSISAGWCLCIVDFTFAVANPTVRRNPTPYISLDNGSGSAANSVSYAGDGTSGVDLWWFNLLPRGAWSLSQRAFFDDFNDSLASIDVNDTRAAGFNWYTHNDWPNNSMYNAGNITFFRSSATPANYISESSSILTLSTDISTYGSGLMTAAYSATSPGYIGQVWPLSFLAETKAGWDPNIGTFSVPAFWTAAIEELVGTAPLNGGFSELDFFEGGTGNPGSEPFGGTSSIRSFKIESFVGNVITQIVGAGIGTIATATRHLFSSLWLGASDNDGVWGLRLTFCDGVMVLNGDSHWSAIAAYNSSDAGLYPFGRWKETNYQSFPIIIGAGLNRPMTVDWVKLYNNPTPPPVLYSTVATVTGSTTRSLAVSANQSGGTLYWIFCTSAVIPTAAQIQAGHDHNDVAAAASGSQAVTATGAQATISATGLAAGTTYSAFCVQNKSSVLSNIDGTAPFPDAATVTWIAAVVSNGGTVSVAREIIVDAFLAGLRSDAILTKFDRLWILAAENSASALTDLIGNVLATTTGSPTFTTDRGYAGTDVAVATKYINTGFIPSSSGVTYTLNSAHISAWCVANVTVSNLGAGCLIGAGETSNTGLNDTASDGNIYGRINELGSGAQGAPTTRAGHWVVDRTDATHSTIYQNAVSFSTPNATSTALPTNSIAILARHASGTFDGGNPNQAAMASIGGHLTAVEVGYFYARLRTLMTAIGVP